MIATRPLADVLRFVVAAEDLLNMRAEASV
jgi:hypothetical protein